jgi:hypothetical protein
MVLIVGRCVQKVEPTNEEWCTHADYHGWPPLPSACAPFLEPALCFTVVDGSKAVYAVQAVLCTRAGHHSLPAAGSHPVKHSLQARDCW